MFDRFAIICCGVLLLAGCSQESGRTKEWAPTMQNPKVRTVKVGAEMPVPEMDDDAVVVAVNGITLTKADIDERLAAFRWSLSKNRMMRAQERDMRYKAFGRSLIGNFINTQVLLWDAREKCHLEEAAVRTFVQSNLTLTAKAYRMKPEQLVDELPGGLATINRAAEEKIWLDTYVENCITHPVVPDQDVTNVLNEIRRENRDIAATNVARKAKLEKIRSSIHPDGGNFEEVLNKLNNGSDEDIEGAGSWGEFKPSEIADEAVRVALDKLEIGQVSGILEDDECYFIVKMTDRRTEDGKEIWSLGKIVITKEPLIVLADEGGMKKDFERQFLNKAISERVDELKQKAQIVYPHGTNFWQVAKAKQNTKTKQK